MNKLTFDFNKEILFGEVGALIGAPLSAFLISKITVSTHLVSSFAVGGAIAGASIFWLFMRIYDKEQEKRFSFRSLESDISYFTPAAFLLTVLVYYPVLFLLSKHLLTQDYKVVSSIIISQVVAFSLFLTSINVYRYILKKFYGKIL